MRSPARGAPGTVLARRYRLLEPLASGPHATVWHACDDVLRRDVAVKLLDDRAAWLSWEREGRAAAAIRHPNVVAVYDAGTSDVGPFVVMELLRGETLARRLARGPLRVEERTRVEDGILAGLVAVHGSGLVHRDVKPGNVFLTDDDRVVLTDFGIARADTSDTTEVAVVGTPGYLAPERAHGAPGTAASDVYAAGQVLTQLHRDEAPRPVAAVLAAATAADPGRRPQDAAELRAALVAAQREGANEPTRVLDTRPSRSHGRFGVALSLALLLCLVAAIGIARATDDSTRSPATVPHDATTLAPTATTSIAATTVPVTARSVVAPTTPAPPPPNPKHHKKHHGG
jgi:serine/threonine-protein kinase